MQVECMFDINLIQFYSFIKGTTKNSKNIHVSYDVTFEDRRNLREKQKKKKKNKGSICLILWRYVRAKKIEQHFIPKNFYEQRGVKDTNTLGAK